MARVYSMMIILHVGHQVSLNSIVSLPTICDTQIKPPENGNFFASSLLAVHVEIYAKQND